MNTNPKPVPQVTHPPRMDEETEKFFYKVAAALGHLSGMDEEKWNSSLPLRKVTEMKFTLGTDGGVSILYTSQGTQYNYHIDGEDMRSAYEPHATQPGNITTTDNIHQEQAEASGNTTTEEAPSPEPEEAAPQTESEKPRVKKGKKDVQDQQDG